MADTAARPTELGDGGWRYHTDGALPVHVWPEGDLVGHDVDSDDDCACLPQSIPVSGGDGSLGWILRHSALDGRP